MEKAIENLNKTMELREDMIDRILRSEEYVYLPDNKFETAERKWRNASFKTLQNKYRKVTTISA